METAAGASEPPGAGRPVVCLGEALVDLVCEQPVASLTEAQAFVPYPGGSLANIAAVTARFGAVTRMLGGAGDDEWGRWLRERLSAEGVGVERFVLVPGAFTSHAFVAVSAQGEPSFAFHGDDERPAAYAAADLEAALPAEDPGVLVLGSDSLLGDREREVTMRAAEIARDRGWLVLCDPNLRERRWSSAEEMLEQVRRLVAGSSVVKCNAAEARRLTGEADDSDAAEALLELGPEMAGVTCGRHGALLARRGSPPASIAGREVGEVVDTTGAGDCVAGVVAAGLAAGVEPARFQGVVDIAMEAAAGVIGRWGALTGLPPAAEARRTLGSLV